MSSALKDRLVALRRRTVARTEQRVLAAWARLRHRGAFAGVERFVVFAGYPRSGHSLVGAFLNAHRDAVIAHELNVAQLVRAGADRDTLYAHIVARSQAFNRRGNRSNYDYQVPGQWQGRWQTLRVIGDKRGGALTRALARHPELLDQLRARVGVPLRVVHVVRHPLDNIAAISIWHRMSLDDSVEFYFEHCRTNAALGRLCAAEELLTLRHEALVADPDEHIRALLRHAGLTPYPGFVDACAAIVFPRPTFTRSKVRFTAELVADVARRAADLPFLSGYELDAAGAAPMVNSSPAP